MHVHSMIYSVVCVHLSILFEYCAKTAECVELALVRAVSLDLFVTYSSWVKPCPQLNISVLERLPSSMRSKDRCSVVSDQIQCFWAICGSVFHWGRFQSDSLPWVILIVSYGILVNCKMFFSRTLSQNWNFTNFLSVYLQCCQLYLTIT